MGEGGGLGGDGGGGGGEGGSGMDGEGGQGGSAVDVTYTPLPHTLKFAETPSSRQNCPL